MGVTYDTGALVAGERHVRRMWALHNRLIAAKTVPTVPAAVLAEAWRGGARQAGLARLLAGCRVEPLGEDQAKEVGVLAGRSGHDDVVDVAVVEGAIRRHDAVVTSNASHIRMVAEAAAVRLTIEEI